MTRVVTGMDIVLVVAARAEAAYLPDDVALVLTGLGKTAAAVALTRALASRPDPRNTHVVNLGTAGALRDGLTGIFRPGLVHNHDLNAEAIRTLGYDPRESFALPGGDPAVALASGDTFVTDADVRARLAAEAHLVDMEGYAVAFAAAAFGSRCTLVKHVSDAADDSAWEWPERVDASARELAAWFAEHRGKLESPDPA